MVKEVVFLYFCGIWRQSLLSFRGGGKRLANKIDQQVAILPMRVFFIQNGCSQSSWGVFCECPSRVDEEWRCEWLGGEWIWISCKWYTIAAIAVLRRSSIRRCNFKWLVMKCDHAPLRYECGNVRIVWVLQSVLQIFNKEKESKLCYSKMCVVVFSIVQRGLALLPLVLAGLRGWRVGGDRTVVSIGRACRLMRCAGASHGTRLVWILFHICETSTQFKRGNGSPLSVKCS